MAMRPPPNPSSSPTTGAHACVWYSYGRACFVLLTVPAPSVYTSSILPDVLTTSHLMFRSACCNHACPTHSSPEPSTLYEHTCRPDGEGVFFSDLTNISVCTYTEGEWNDPPPQCENSTTGALDAAGGNFATGSSPGLLQIQEVCLLIVCRYRHIPAAVIRRCAVNSALAWATGLQRCGMQPCSMYATLSPFM